MNPITPCLRFDSPSGETANFYCGIVAAFFEACAG